MEGKRLYFPTNPSPEIEKFENKLVTLFNEHAIKHKVNPTPVLHMVHMTHMQYIDREGVIHLKSREDDIAPYCDIVQFRLLKAKRKNAPFPSFKTNLGELILWYREQVILFREEIK